MNEEEKKAIEDIKRELSDEDKKEYMSSWFAKDLDIAVNLIEKLQKENEELKESNKIYDLQGSNINLEIYIKDKYISKQEVKAKIEKEIKYHEKNILDIENITMLKGKTAKEEAEIEFNKYAIEVLKKMLQELLEGRK